MAEEDPTRFATMAETLPEPPPFVDLTPEALAALPPLATDESEGEADIETDGMAEATAEATAEAVVVDDPMVDDAAVEPAMGETEPDVAEADASEPEAVEAETEPVVAETEPVVAETEPGVATDDGGWAGENTGAEAGFDGETGDGEFDREAAFAAIQAAAEAAASAEIATDAATRAEEIAEVAIEIVGSHEGDPEADPRVAALGLSPDFDLAEVEAMNGVDSEHEAVEISDETLAARLAGLVPGGNDARSGESRSTQVVVVGLVSVASIASFKRHLGRVAGVQSVGVSSGPEGEFVFAVNHAGDVNLRDAIPTLPSFQARVTGAGEGTLNVTAHDPESGD
jgi:hypothetical protein